MPRIVAYHPVIEVYRGDESVKIELDLDNWYPAGDVVRALKECTGAATGGEAVGRVKSRALRLKNSPICLGARILDDEDAEPTVRLPWAKKLN